MNFLDFLEACSALTKAFSIDIHNTAYQCSRFNSFFELETFDEVNASNFSKSRKYWNEKYVYSRAWDANQNSASELEHQYPAIALFRIGPDQVNRRCEVNRKVYLMFLQKRPDSNKTGTTYCETRTHTQAMNDLESMASLWVNSLVKMQKVVPVIAGVDQGAVWCTGDFAEQNQDWDSYRVEIYLSHFIGSESDNQNLALKSETFPTVFADDLMAVAISGLVINSKIEGSAQYNF